MLSERERRALTDIENDLAAASPVFARRMRRPSSVKGQMWALPVTSAVAGLALAVLMIALGLSGQAFVIVVLFAWPLGRKLRLRRVRIRWSPKPQP